MTYLYRHMNDEDYRGLLLIVILCCSLNPDIPTAMATNISCVLGEGRSWRAFAGSRGGPTEFYNKGGGGVRVQVHGNILTSQKKPSKWGFKPPTPPLGTGYRESVTGQPAPRRPALDNPHPTIRHITSESSSYFSVAIFLSPSVLVCLHSFCHLFRHILMAMQVRYMTTLAGRQLCRDVKK